MDGEEIATAGSWEQIQLSAKMREALAVVGFTDMTPVQAATIPLFLAHKDVVVEAATGSGKTLAFVIPIIEMILRREESWAKNEIGAIIVSPTRELAKQISDVVKSFLRHTNPEITQDDSDQELETRQFNHYISHQLFIGGTSVNQDIANFKKNGGNILVGTPGRLDDILKTRSLLFNTKNLQVLVLDEADRLLEFQSHVSSILVRLPKQRRTGLFSATMSEALDGVIKAGLRNPVKVAVKVESVKQLKGGASSSTSASASDVNGHQLTPTTLSIGYTIVEPHEKLEQLFAHVKEYPTAKSIVYFATCAMVDYYYTALTFDNISDEGAGGNSNRKKGSTKKQSSSWPGFSKYLEGIQVFSLHGKMDPKRRQIVYEKFTSCSTPCILLTTDVSSRGLDIPDVDWVIQHDPPQDPKSFSHRCGRTARAGRVGSAMVYLAAHEETYVEFLRIRKIPLDPFQRLHLSSSSSADSSNKPILDTLRAQNKCDRDIFDKSIKAFTSYIRSYTEHQASSIFSIRRVDFASLAKSFGLLRMPKVPEIKGKVEGFEEERVDPATIPFKNPQREKQRQSNLSNAEAVAAAAAAKKAKLEAKRKAAKESAPWSQHKAAKERRNERRIKKIRKKEAIAANSGANESETSVSGGSSYVSSVAGLKRKQAEEKEDGEDWKELKKAKKTARGGGKGNSGVFNDDE